MSDTPKLPTLVAHRVFPWQLDTSGRPIWRCVQCHFACPWWEAGAGYDLGVHCEIRIQNENSG